LHSQPGHAEAALFNVYVTFIPPITIIFCGPNIQQTKHRIYFVCFPFSGKVVFSDWMSGRPITGLHTALKVSIRRRWCCILLDWGRQLWNSHQFDGRWAGKIIQPRDIINYYSSIQMFPVRGQ
jgi:hypothetical protein